MDLDKKYKEYKGLSSEEVSQLIHQYGENSIKLKKRIGPILSFLEKVMNPLMILMVGISIVSFAVGQRTSAMFVIAMVILSAFLDFLNSYRSGKAVEKLSARVSSKTTAIRSGEKQEIETRYVVPGDILFLSAGNVIPADGQVLASDDFFVNQSSLTGESIPVEKISIKDQGTREPIEDDAKIFMGTSVVSGFAIVLVEKTGLSTQFGKIAEDLNKAEPRTNFEVAITKFSYFIMKLVFFMAGFVMIVYLFKNSDHLNRSIILEAITFALAITIGVTPDMLPAIITVSLSRGSMKMAKKEVIVKHLTAIENFGSMDVLCTDKTGTLTQDQITLVKYIDYKGVDSKKVLELGHLSSHFHTGVNNPLDAAINDFKDIDVAHYKKIDEIPYDFTRRRSSMVVSSGGKRFLITKGAPEDVLKVCTSFELNGRQSKTVATQEIISKQFNDLSGEGFRVLGLAYKEIPDDTNTSYDRKTEMDMVFVGFLAFLDPPKEGVSETIAQLAELGISIKILTGDNDLLAQKICRDIGITISGVLSGAQIEKMDDLELMSAVKTTNIFARINPLQKERIILILKKNGQAVGYLGDGINDAPALKAADVGISVENAVDIAKDTADIILVKKSLESLREGVIEGRKTFHNTLKYVLMGLSSNFGNMFSMMGAVTFLPFLPMMPAQILLNNFIYDSSQFALPTDEVDEEDLKQPAHWDLKFIRRYMLVFGLISSAFDFLTFFLLYFYFHLGEHQFQTGWFIMSMTTQIFVVYIIRTKKIPFIQSRPSRALVGATLLAVATAWIIPFTFLGKMLQFANLPYYVMLSIASYVILYLIVAETGKRIFYHHYFKNVKKV